MRSPYRYRIPELPFQGYGFCVPFGGSRPAPAALGRAASSFLPSCPRLGESHFVTRQLRGFRAAGDSPSRVDCVSTEVLSLREDVFPEMFLSLARFRLNFGGAPSNCSDTWLDFSFSVRSLVVTESGDIFGWQPALRCLVHVFFIFDRLTVTGGVCEICMQNIVGPRKRNFIKLLIHDLCALPALVAKPKTKISCIPLERNL